MSCLVSFPKQMDRQPLTVEFFFPKKCFRVVIGIFFFFFAEVLYKERVNAQFFFPNCLARECTVPASC